MNSPIVVLERWHSIRPGILNNECAYAIVPIQTIPAKILLKKIKQTALTLNFKDYTYGKRDNAIEFLTLAKNNEDRPFVHIERRKSSQFPFKTYLKAWRDEHITKEDFERDFQAILNKINQIF